MSKPKKGGLRSSSIAAFTGKQLDSTPAESVTTRYPIDVILPDPQQPRHMLPPKVKDRLHSGRISPREALEEWIEHTKKGKAKPLYVSRLEGVREMAESLEREGLIHAIRIREPMKGEKFPKGFLYMIGIGERRYWAHHLLLMENRTVREEGEDVSPKTIKAEFVPPDVDISVYQMAENLHSEDLNAVEKAHAYMSLRRQLASDKLEDNPSPTSIPWEVVESTVPWKDVESLVKPGRRYRRYVLQVLDLSEDAQQTILDYELPERTVRPLHKLKDHPELLSEMLDAIIKSREGGGEGFKVTDIERMVSDLLRGVKPSAKKDAPVFSPMKIQRKVISPLGVLNDLSSDDLKKVAREMDNNTAEKVRKLKDLLETMLREYMAPK